jgi:hypothetical protein
VVLEQRKPDPDEGPGVEVEETDVASKVGVAGVEGPSGNIIQR